MVFKAPSEILQKVLRFKAIRHKEGEFLLFGNPCSILPVYIKLYLQKLMEQKCKNIEVCRSFYYTAKLQAEIGMKIVNQKFGYAKRFIDKKRLLEFNLGQTEFLGLGKYKFTKIDLENSEVIVKGISPYAKEYKRFFGIQKNPVDYFIMGLLAGGIGNIMGADLFCLETKCIAQGNEHCEFVLKPIEQWDKKNVQVKFLLKKAPTMEELGARTKPYVTLPHS